MTKKLILSSKIGIYCANFFTFCPTQLHIFFKTVLNKFFKVGYIHHYYSYISEASHLMCAFLTYSVWHSRNNAV